MTLHAADQTLVVLCDMDAVVADWGARYDALLDAHGDAAALIPRTAQQVGWELTDGRTEAEKQVIRQVMTDPDFYQYIPVIPGAVDAIRALRERGHEVFFVTAPYLTNPTCASAKLAWVAEHFGGEMAKRTIITIDKTTVRGDVLIDDKPVITGAFEPLWKRIVFGEYRYNQDVTDPRLPSWLGIDVVSTVERLAGLHTGEAAA